MTDPAMWGIVIDGITALGAIVVGLVGYWVGRRTSRDTVRVEGERVTVEASKVDVEERRVDLDEWKALTEAQSAELAAARKELAEATQQLREARTEHLAATTQIAELRITLRIADEYVKTLERHVGLLEVWINEGQPPPPPPRPARHAAPTF